MVPSEYHYLGIYAKYRIQLEELAEEPFMPYVSMLKLGPWANDSDLELLHLFTGIRELTFFKNHTVTEKGVARLSKMKGLETLAFYDSETVSDCFVVGISAIPQQIGRASCRERV